MTVTEPSGVAAPAEMDSERSVTSLVPAGALAAIVIGMAAAGIYRRGAFYPGDAFGIAVVSTALIAVVISKHRDRDGVAVLVSVGTLVLWWLIRANTARSPAAFLPLGASLLGFVAAFLVIRTLGEREHARVATVVTVVGCLSSATGLIGVMWHVHPVAEQAGGVWRVATTMTYPAAGAALFAIALLLAMALDLSSPLPRVAVCLCLAGLIATMSHWDLLALAGGALLVPRERWLKAVWPLAMGLLVGTIVVVSASGHRSAWPSTAAAAAVVLAAMLTTRTSRPEPRPMRAAAAVVTVAVCTVLVMVHPPVGHLAPQPESQGQTLAWSAASQGWRSSPVTGTGPARIGTTHGPVDANLGFGPDAYLTVIAEGGLVGGVLLVGAGATVAAAIRRRDLLSSCAAGATVAFALAGGVDFDWHLPALAVVGGCAAGLAARQSDTGEGPASEDGRRRGQAVGGAAVVWTLVVLAVVAIELLVGTVQEASAIPRAQRVEPAPTATPLDPARYILTGPDPTDPFMLKISGRYYLYTSEGTSYMSVPLRTAVHLGAWSKPVDVLPHLPNWAEGGLTWAPDVQRVKGGWALYFTALLRGVEPFTHCIGAAFASSPAGPFDASAQPFICQLDHRGSIDARVFVDTGNRLVMLWKSEDNANPNVPGPDQNGNTGIYAQSLSADGRTLLGPAVKIFGPSEPWEGTIVEAPDMIEAWGTYWMVFSGNWYYSTSYGIGVASCESPFGPCSDPRSGPMLGSNRQGAGPGESSLFRDGSDVYVLYNPFRANDPGPVIPRPVAMARLGFTPNGPYLAAS